MPNLNSWFFLKGERRSFKPHPLQDRDVMFCHQDVEGNIRVAIERAYALGETVKLLLWGNWGVGKTHTLRHIEYWLSTHSEDFPAKTVFVEIGDVSRNSSFQVIHKDLLDGIGLPKLIDLAFGFMREGGDLMSGLEGIGIPGPIRQAFNKLYVATPGSAPPDLVVMAWNYLKGDDIGTKGAALGLPRQLTDGKEFYYVLAALGFIFQKVDHRQLLFLVDEGAKLEAVSATQEMERHWVNVNKLIFDQDNTYFGFVYTVSGSADEIPAALFEPQIENRLGNRRMELRNLPADGVRDFIRNLTASFVNFDTAESDTEASLTSNSEYSRDSYPFADAAFDRFVEYFQRTQENSKPRDICAQLDDAAFYAMKANKRLIDDEILDQLGL
jgi:hypothetical protein